MGTTPLAMFGTETSGKDDGDPQLVPRGDNAAIESVKEAGTADAPTADDAPTVLPPDHRSYDKRDMRRQHGNARQV